MTRDADLLAHAGANDISVDRVVRQSDWDAFVGTQTAGSFYHLSGWGQINRQQLHHEYFPLIARSGSRIRGILPLVEVRSCFFGKILCSMPFVNYCGPCVDDPAIAQVLATAASRLANDIKADYLEMRSAAELPIALPVSLRKVSVTIGLDPNSDKLWNSFATKHRTNIRRVYKNGVAVKSGGVELLDTFYAVMRESWRDLGTPLYRRDYFAAILAEFPETRIFVAHINEKAIAVAFNGHFNGTVEGMWAGGLPAARNLQANYVLYWEMIKDACERGFRRFHLGRSTAESGGEQFKKKWNATASQLYWYYYRADGGPIPSLNVDNPRYQLAIRVWKRMPLAITDLLGPKLARLIP